MLPPTEVKPKIGIIAGQGSIPESLVARWESQGMLPVIVGLKGITSPSLFTNRIAAEFSIGQAGHILHFLQSHGVRQLVMIGALKRPNLWTIIPDGAGFKILARLLWHHGRAKLGDDGLLRFVRREIERYGIDIIGAHEFMPELLCSAGVLTRTAPDDADLQVITKGFAAAKQHGAEDKGQSIVINEAGICGVESSKGTNALIASCAGQAGAILVKAAKPQQDMALDMPTIGLATVENIIRAGFKGMAVEAGKTMIVDRDSVVRLCDEHKLFLIGIEG